MTSEILIQARRAATCWDDAGNPKVGIGDYILEYGELLYLEDLDIIVVGDGRQYEYEELAQAKSKTPSSVHYAKDVGKWIGGSTVAELVSEHEYFAKVLNPTIYGQAEYQYINASGQEDIIPLTTQDNTIANTRFAVQYTDQEIAELKKIIGSQSISNTNLNYTLVKFETDADGKVTLTFNKIDLPYSDITGNKPVASSDSTDYPKMDGVRACGDNEWIYAREDHVHPTDTTRAPLEAPHFTNITEGTTIKDVPQSTTAAEGTNTAQIATCAFVTTAVAHKSVVETKQNSSDGTIFVTGVLADTEGAPIPDSALYYNSSGSNNASGVRIDCAKGVLMGSAWNDFAEYRKCNAEPGTVVCETGKGDLTISEKRLQPGAAIVSDTYGMIIGPQASDYQPIAVAGRVLAKYFGSKQDFIPGMPVCAGPLGMVYPMARFEIKEFPESIVGYVSEIPDYDEWNGIKVNNRIWIKVK